MDSQLQNGFFKQFEQVVYYDRYFKELKTREDGRKFQQVRKINIVLNSLKNIQGNCILKKGKMVIVCQIKAQFQQQFINVLSNKPQIPLLKVEVSLPESRQLTNFEKRKKQSYISYLILEELNKLDLQSQLLIKSKHKLFGYRLDIQIRVLSEDGSVFEHCLLASQLALQTTKLKTQLIQGQDIKQTQTIRTLDLNQFLVPNILSSVNNQIVIDPSYEQQRVQSYSLTNWIDIVSNNHSISKSGDQEIQSQIIQKFQQQTQQQRANIKSKLNFKDINAKLLSNPQLPLTIQLQI